MKFGQVEHPESVDFTLPPDHPDTAKVLGGAEAKRMNIAIGCAKWNRQDLKGFYPRGIKDELIYYASQFNSIELNATFYQSPSKQQVETWTEKTPKDFTFYPKVPSTISHYRRLLNFQEPLTEFCDAISHFEDKLGMAFLQLHDNFKPQDFERLDTFLKAFPKAIPLGVEVRNEAWFADEQANHLFFNTLKDKQHTAILVDTAGRRDMMHMRLTTPIAFIRYVGANHESDYERLDEWVKRIKKWKAEGLQSLYFFVHQNVERESPLLSQYFIEKLNAAIGTDLRIPTLPEKK